MKKSGLLAAFFVICLLWSSFAGGCGEEAPAAPENLCPVRMTPLTTNGIAFTPNGDGTYLVNGTSEKGANYNLYYSRTELPAGFEAGKAYHLEYADPSGTDYLRICMYYYDAAGGEERQFLNTYQTADFTVPTEAVGLLIRIRVVAANVQINRAVVCPVIREARLFDPDDLCPVRMTSLKTNGIVFTPNGDRSYLVNGTSEKGANYNLYYSRTELPAGFEAGKTYHLAYADTSGTDYLRICMYYYDEAGGEEQKFLEAHASTDFTIPAEAVGLLIRIRVVAANVQIDRAVVRPAIAEAAEKEYPRPMLTIIDDDGSARYYRDLLPLCIGKGVSIASAVVPLQIEARENGETQFWMSWAEIAECQSHGIEILSHTYDHAATAAVEEQSIDEIRNMYQLAKDTLSQHGIDTSILVYSGGTGSLAKCRAAASSVYAYAIRAGGDQDNLYGQMDPYSIWRYSAAPENMKGLLDQLSRNGTGWMVWMLHTSDPQWGDAFVQALAESIDYAEALGIPIVTAKEGASCYWPRQPAGRPE